MDTYAGKHLLIDCYGCRPEFISSEDHLAHVLDAASQQLDMMPGDTSLYDEEGEIILAAFSAGAISAFMPIPICTMPPSTFTASIPI